MCQTCDKLRAEIRELREELAEWERLSEEGVSGVIDNDSGLIAATIGVGPQEGRLISTMMLAASRTVSTHDLVRAMKYEGEDGEYEDSRGITRSHSRDQLKVVVCRARAALTRAGIHEAIHTIRCVGYIMPKRKAQEIRKLAGIE